MKKNIKKKPPQPGIQCQEIPEENRLAFALGSEEAGTEKEDGTTIPEYAEGVYNDENESDE